MKQMKKQNNKKFIAKKTKKKSGEFKTPNFLETTTKKSMIWGKKKGSEELGIGLHPQIQEVISLP